jgi:hypothetical protein
VRVRPPLAWIDEKSIRVASLEDCAHCAVRYLDLRLGRLTVARY